MFHEIISQSFHSFSFSLSTELTLSFLSLLLLSQHFPLKQTGYRVLTRKLFLPSTLLLSQARVSSEPHNYYVVFLPLIFSPRVCIHTFHMNSFTFSLYTFHTFFFHFLRFFLTTEPPRWYSPSAVVFFSFKGYSHIPSLCSIHASNLLFSNFSVCVSKSIMRDLFEKYHPLFFCNAKKKSTILMD